MRHPPRLLAALLAGALAACGGSSSPPPAAGPRTVTFQVQPAGTSAGAPFQVVVQVTDAAGTVAGAPVALSLAAGPSGAALGGTTTRATGSTGLATFAGLSLTRAGSGYALRATSGDAHADSAAFAVSPGVPDAASSSLVGPSAGVEADGATTALVTATVRDVHANAVPGATVAFAAPGASLSWPTAETDAAGQAWVTACATTAGTVTVTATIGGGARQVDVRFTGRPLWVTGYYLGNQHPLYPPARVDYSALTHVVVGPVAPYSDGTLDDSFAIDPSYGPSVAQEVAARAHAAGRRALLMVGGPGLTAGLRSAASSARRATLVANLVALQDRLGFDGFDLYWSPLAEPDLPDLLALAAALRAAAPGVTLTVPLAWVDSSSGGAASWHGPLADAFDQVNVMTYGMADGWPGWVSWHSAALAGEAATHPSSVSYAVSAYAAPGVGIPKARLGIGIGFFGSCWQGVTAPLQTPTGPVVASDNQMSYRNVMADYHPAGAYHWDAGASMGYLSFAAQTGPQGCTFISYEDADSIAAKGRWVQASGFGGTILWTVAQGATSAAGPNPLLTAVKGAFLP